MSIKGKRKAVDKLKATLSFTFTFAQFTCTFPLFPFPLSFSLHVEHVERGVLHFLRAPPLVLPIYALTTFMLSLDPYLRT